MSTMMQHIRSVPSEPIPEKPTLEWILKRIDEMNEGLVTTTIQELESITDLCREKIDAYEAVISRLEGESDRLAKRIEPIQKEKAKVDKSIARIKELLVYSLKKRGLTRFDGVENSVFLRPSKAVSVKAEPTIDLYARFPKLMRMVFSWDKNAIKQALAEGDAEVAKFAEIEERYAAHFDIRKDRR